jgi:protocatechuate 3,4-dioxygenase, alpha subunit
LNPDLCPTPSQTAGPFFHLGCTENSSVANLTAPETKGERICLTCRVVDGDGIPVPDGMIELWQANSEGKYSHPEDLQPAAIDPAFSGFGRLATDENGVCTFQTILPGRVPAGDGKLQAAHINVSVFARGILKRLATRIYFAGHPALADDPILALVPSARRHTLLAKETSAGNWIFDIYLCGENETVFFDV